MWVYSPGYWRITTGERDRRGIRGETGTRGMGGKKGYGGGFDMPFGNIN